MKSGEEEINRALQSHTIQGSFSTVRVLVKSLYGGGTIIKWISTMGSVSSNFPPSMFRSSTQKQESGVRVVETFSTGHWVLLELSRTLKRRRSWREIISEHGIPRIC